MVQTTPIPDKPKESKRGLFFDRDGILNRVVMRGNVVGSPRSLAEFSVFPETPELLRRASSKGQVIIVTNQPDLSKGALELPVLEQMHTHLQASAAGCIDLILWEGSSRPDHPRRKPHPLMLLEAATKLSLDLARSWIIGDSIKDLKAGESAGVQTVLLQAEYNREIHGRGHINIQHHQELIQWLEDLP